MIKQLAGFNKNTQWQTCASSSLFMEYILVWHLEWDLRMRSWECILEAGKRTCVPSRKGGTQGEKTGKPPGSTWGYSQVWSHPNQKLTSHLGLFSWLIRAEQFQKSWWVFASYKDILYTSSMFLLGRKILIKKKKCAYNLAPTFWPLLKFSLNFQVTSLLLIPRILSIFLFLSSQQSSTTEDPASFSWGSPHPSSIPPLGPTIWLPQLCLHQLLFLPWVFTACEPGFSVDHTFSRMLWKPSVLALTTTKSVLVPSLSPRLHVQGSTCLLGPPQPPKTLATMRPTLSPAPSCPWLSIRASHGFLPLHSFLSNH